MAKKNDKAFLAVDTETTGLQFHKPYDGFHEVCCPYFISCCDYEGKTKFWEFTVSPKTRAVSRTRKQVWEVLDYFHKYPRLVFHNALFDLHALDVFMKPLKLQQTWFETWEIHDTWALSHLFDSGEKHGLKPLAERYLGTETTDQDIIHKETISARLEAKRLGIPLGPEVACDMWMARQLLQSLSLREYGCTDAERTAALFLMYEQLLHQSLYKRLLPFYTRERQIIPVVYRMEDAGIRLRSEKIPGESITYLEQLHQTHDQLANVCEKRIRKIALQKGLTRAFNVRSTEQLASLLYDKLKLPIISRTEGGKPSVDQDTLTELLSFARTECQEQALEDVLTYRVNNTAQKFVNGYEERATWETRARRRSLYLFPHFLPWGTRTTRFSSYDPNAQNVSSQPDSPLRSIFGPGLGKTWWSFDYNQLEIRLMAKASGDHTLTQMLASGGDQHQITADALNARRTKLGLDPLGGDLKRSRKIAKNINFAWQYGAGDTKLSLMAGINAQDFSEVMRSTYPGVVSFMDNVTNEAAETGIVLTLYGYPLQVNKYEPYKGINYVIQGSAGDVCKLAMIQGDTYIHDEHLSKNLRLILTIHDELIYEADEKLPVQHLRALHNIFQHIGDDINCILPVSVSRVSHTKGWDEKESDDLIRA